MRVALFAESFLPKMDGVANTLCYLLRHLEKRGIQAMMFCPEGAPSEYAGARIVGLTSFPFPWYPELKLVTPLINVREELEAFDADIVHLVNPAILGLHGLREARTLGLPIVASYHTDIPGYAERYGWSLMREPLWGYFRWLHNQADLNYCPSEFTRQELVEHGFERLKIWRRGVDPERFGPQYRSQEWRERLSDGHPDAPLMLYVGRLATEKRVAWLRPLIDALPDARLAIVGDGPQGPETREQLAGTPTVFTGFLRGEDLSHAYASADLFVFPSANETFGNVVLEAMASGLPVVAPSAGGPVDHVIGGYNGYLFDAESQISFVRTVHKVIRAPEHMAEMSQGALAHARGQSWEAILDEVVDDYEQLVQHYSGPREPHWKEAVADRLEWLRQAYNEHRLVPPDGE